MTHGPHAGAQLLMAWNPLVEAAIWHPQPARGVSRGSHSTTARKRGGPRGITLPVLLVTGQRPQGQDSASRAPLAAGQQDREFCGILP